MRIETARLVIGSFGLAAFLAAGVGAKAQLPSRESTAKMAPDASALSNVQALIVDFLEHGYLQAWFAHPESVRQHFADPVENYWGRRNVPLKDIVQEKLGIARKWTFRFYRLQRDTVRFEAVPGRDGLWKVTFMYDFIADAVPARSQGSGETTLVVQVDGDAVKIHSESGRVLERKRTGT